MGRLMFAFLVFGVVVSGWQWSRPIQLITVNNATSVFVVSEEAALRFRSLTITHPLYTVGVSGPKRTGKSFFLNALDVSVDFPGNLSDSSLFVVSGSTTSITRGIWVRIAEDPALVKENMPLKVYIDSEGLNDPLNSDAVDQKLCALVHLLSRTFFIHYKSLLDKETKTLLKFSSQLRDELKSKLRDSQHAGAVDFTNENFIVQSFELAEKVSEDDER